MLEESYKDLISKGYSKEFLNKISDIISSENKMHQNIRYINLYKNKTIIKCIAITDEGTYYRIVEQIRDKNKFIPKLYPPYAIKGIDNILNFARLVVGSHEPSFI